MFQKADLEAQPSPAKSAATVIVLRDGLEGLEALLLRRNPELKVMAGAWVFPGGKVEATDPGEDSLECARAGALRELSEETGLCPALEGLIHFSRWLTPEVVKHRFDTYFFVAVHPKDKAVTVDGSEIVDHRWVRPGDAVAEQAAGDLKLPPPTLVSLSDLAEHSSVEGVLATVRDREPPYFFPRIVEHGDDHVFLYPGDAGYEVGDVALDSPCHRTVMHEGRFTYHRNFSWPPRPR